MNPGSPYIGATVEADLNTEDALIAIKAGTLIAIKHVFETKVLQTAKANCPVGTDPIEPGSERNRESLAVESWITHKGPIGKLFSQSGHGGFVEVGTVHMSAQPYAWPALQSNIGALMAEIKMEIASITVPTVQLGRVMVTEERNLG